MFSLLMAVTCGFTSIGPVKIDRKHQTQGLFVCAEAGQRNIAVTLPPRTGQFVIQTKQAIIDQFDFDLNPSSTGTWFWKKTYTKDLGAVVAVPAGISVAVLSVAAKDTGIQSGEVQYLTGNTEEIDYTCGLGGYQTGSGSPWSYGPGVGGCQALDGSNTVVTLDAPAKSRVRLSGCVDEVVDSVEARTITRSFDVRDCVLGIRTMTETVTKTGVVVYRTEPRTAERLSKPQRVGKDIRWPVGATVNEERAGTLYSWNERGSFAWSN